MQVRLYYQTVLTDQQGKVIQRSRKRRSRSFVLQFLNHLRMAFDNIDLTILRTTGVGINVQQPNASVLWLAMNGVAGDVNRGPVVGTGTAAEAMDDFDLAAAIAHGTGAGQLQYGAVAISAVGETGTTAEFTLTRSFTNGSGASITVNEIGLRCESHDVIEAEQPFLICRDKLAVGDAVGNGQTQTVVYTITITV